MRARTRGTLRVVASGAGLAWGAVLFARPTLVASLLDEGEPSHTELLLTRVLGARHLVEAVVLAVPSRRTGRPLLWTEGSHAASMALLAAASPRHRRVALASLSAALVLGAATAAAARGTPR